MRDTRTAGEMRALPGRARLGMGALLALGAIACAGRMRTPGAVPAAGGAPARASRGGGGGAREALYREAGLIVSADTFSFVGATGILAGPAPDSTLLLVALSLANAQLSFTSDGGGRRASYTVRTALHRGDSSVVEMTTSPLVRVAAAADAARPGEGIIFQQLLPAPPGRYTLVISVRDDGSGAVGRYAGPVIIPALGPSVRQGATSGAARGVPPTAPPGVPIARPIPVYEAAPRRTLDSLPSVIPNPRATVVFGRDSLARYYLEAYTCADTAVAPARVAVSVRDSGEAVVWADTIALAAGQPPLCAGTVRVPVSRLGPGMFTVGAALAGTGGVGAPERAPLLITFGEGFAGASFEQMLDYLRYFATPAQRRALERSPPDARASAWAAFLRQTDRDPATPENEALEDYMGRIRQANAEFTGEGMAGWRTERGRVFVTLGAPDQIVEESPSTLSLRGQLQLWRYARYQVQLLFVDATGLGRWQLAPGSAAEFEALAQRERQRPQE